VCAGQVWAGAPVDLLAGIITPRATTFRRFDPTGCRSRQPRGWPRGLPVPENADSAALFLHMADGRSVGMGQFSAGPATDPVPRGLGMSNGQTFSEKLGYLPSPGEIASFGKQALGNIGQ
jgi:hypothetical protein